MINKVFGAFVLASLAVPAAAQPAPNPARGKVLFMQCVACHSTAKGAPHKVGPNLSGIVGTQAGTRPGYAYSQAIKKSNVRWDDARLSSLIAKPNALIPGTKMVYPGMADAAKRADIIAYLKTLR